MLLKHVIANARSSPCYSPPKWCSGRPPQKSSARPLNLKSFFAQIAVTKSCRTRKATDIRVSICTNNSII